MPLPRQKPRPSGPRIPPKGGMAAMQRKGPTRRCRTCSPVAPRPSPAAAIPWPTPLPARSRACNAPGPLRDSSSAQPALSHLAACCNAPERGGLAAGHADDAPAQPALARGAAQADPRSFRRPACLLPHRGSQRTACPPKTSSSGSTCRRPRPAYPPHCHHAEEFYLILSGTALWGLDLGSEAPIAPGGWSHHAPDQWHATRTTAEPLLALWGWLGDLDFASYRIAN